MSETVNTAVLGGPVEQFDLLDSIISAWHVPTMAPPDQDEPMRRPSWQSNSWKVVGSPPRNSGFDMEQNFLSSQFLAQSGDTYQTKTNRKPSLSEGNPTKMVSLESGPRTPQRNYTFQSDPVAVLEHGFEFVTLHDDALALSDKSSSNTSPASRLPEVPDSERRGRSSSVSYTAYPHSFSSASLESLSDRSMEEMWMNEVPSRSKSTDLLHSPVDDHLIRRHSAYEFYDTFGGRSVDSGLNQVWPNTIHSSDRRPHTSEDGYQYTTGPIGSVDPFGTFDDHVVPSLARRKLTPEAKHAHTHSRPSKSVSEGDVLQMAETKNVRHGSYPHQFQSGALDRFGNMTSDASGASSPAALPADPSTPVYAVLFKPFRRELFFSNDPLYSALKTGQHVIVEADRGEDVGCVVEASRLGQLSSEARLGLKKLYRLAEVEEIDTLGRKGQDEAIAMRYCCAKVRQKKLPMEVIYAEYQWDRKKLTFYFRADRRIDFRELVRDLFKEYKTRIWMCEVDENNNIKFRA